MGVSLSGASMAVTTVRRTAALVVVAFVALAYLYLPAASPTLRSAAVARCNDHAGGNYRSYRLSWHTGLTPHWACWDASRPEEPAVSLGWWTNPLR